MIIDFHAHAFPDELAKRTIPKLAAEGNIINYADGTKSNLTSSMKEAGIDLSILLPIATKPTQTEKLNRLAAKTNETTKQTGLFSFGTLHPDQDNYKTVIKQIADDGLKGVKLHPYYQNTAIDDIRMLRITDCIQEHQLIALFHVGYDVGFPYCCYATPDRCLRLIKELHPDKLVFAHMGGWNCWQEVYEMLAGLNVYFDTAFSLGVITPYQPNSRTQEESQMLTNQQFLRLVRKHGTNRILFGTDSPWGGQKETLNLLDNCGLTKQELRMIKGENAVRLLGLDSFSPAEIKV